MSRSLQQNSIQYIHIIIDGNQTKLKKLVDTKCSDSTSDNQMDTGASKPPPPLATQNASQKSSEGGTK